MQILSKKICVIGVGYIGLPTAALLAQKGYEVIGYDVNPHVVEALNKGKIIIEEPNLAEVVKTAVQNGKLKGVTEIEPADVFFISVPTPIKEDHCADVSYIQQACESILKVLKKGDMVILESTSPLGTTEELVVNELKKSGLDIGKDIFVAHTPERVIPGDILRELIENNRVIGGVNKESAEAIAELFRTFVNGEIRITDAATAEMCKVMENTYRDVNIALANEMAIICETMGISAWEVRELANLHPRVNLHMPGPGVGGHCIAVDPWFLVERNPKEAQLIHMSRNINDSMPQYVFNKILSKLPLKDEINSRQKVVILGVTFKPNVDDTRESPILKLINILEENRYDVVVCDPHVKKYDMDLYDALENGDIVVLAVDHDEFKTVDFDKMYELLKHPKVLDTRNLWSKYLTNDDRFEYTVLGRG